VEAVAAVFCFATILITGNSRSTVVYMDSNNDSNKVACSVISQSGAGQYCDAVRAAFTAAACAAAEPSGAAAIIAAN
jgi:hypothetical protein